MNILLIGVGQFGSALAHTYQNQGIRVFKIPSSKAQLRLSSKDLQSCVTLLCVPTQKIPEVVAQRITLIKETQAVVSTAKGIIRQTQCTAGQYLAKHLSPKKILIMSGPSFASELRRDLPTALVLAGRDKKKIDLVTKQLSTPQLRLYKSNDPDGVELCGALKNIYAIGSGMVEGLGLGQNTKMALTTRALAEMSHIGKALGCHPYTFFGLAGVGDLFLTCSSSKSRNFQFGFGFAQGQSKDALLRRLGTVEGLWTAEVAKKICRKHSLNTPVLDVIVRILTGRLSPASAIEKLMLRQSRYEFS